MNVIAEIGINHNGKLSLCRKLIEAASRSCVQAVKFQYRNIDRTYFKEKEIGDEILSFEIKKNFIGIKDIVSLRAYAKTLNLKVGISFFSKEDVLDFKRNIKKFDFFKIPSVELKNLTLIKYLLKLKKHVYISTGAHGEKEIEKTFFAIQNYQNWTPMHCISNYPTTLFNSKIGYIKYLKKKWKREVGFSSHESNFLSCIEAISKGASCIERHITLDNHSNGLDHSSSSVEEDFRKIVEYWENLKPMNSGNSARICNQGELINRQNLGRSYYFKKNIKIGQKISKNDIAYRSPAVGYGAQDQEFFLNRKIIKKADVGNVITKDYFIKDKNFDDKTIDKCNEYKISLPVRFHDYEDVCNSFPIKNFELHLSYTELLNQFPKINFSKNHNYTIHIPDYISSTELINPFSSNYLIRKKSYKIIKNTLRLAKYLSHLTRKKIILVSSISNLENLDKNIFYKKCKALQKNFNCKYASFTFQILPPFAWYFGGSFKINSFCSKDDFKLIVKHNLKITLDLSHLIMSSNYFNFNTVESIKNLKKITEHVHLAFASGIDNEGESFKNLDKKNKLILKKILNFPCKKVIEVWQGHLNNYSGFRKSLNLIKKYPI
jgi:N-acetylneuraminate synthase